MSLALFGSIWIALALFVVGEVGKRRVHSGAGPPRWAWPAWLAGVLTCIAHMLIAFFGWHGGSQESVLTATARATAAVYGIAWGGGVYVNYAFAGVWLADVIWWRASPERYRQRSSWVTWTLRVFYFVVILNAAVIFASPRGRLVGVPLTAALAWSYRWKK